MTVELSTPKHIATLRDCAMQCNLEVRMWLGVVQDDQLSDEVITSKGAEQGSAKVMKNLLATCSEHIAIKKSRSRAYNWFKSKTHPWAGSMGLVPIYDYPNVMQTFEGDIQPEYMRLVDAFIPVYKDLRSNHAFKMQGKMYNPNDYPEPEYVRHKFSMTLFTQMIPESDFSTRMGMQIAGQLHEHYCAQAGQFVKETGERQLAQLAKVMQSISHCCEMDVKETATGEVKVTRRRLHESTLKKAIEYCDVFKHFNPSGDTRLEGIRADLERVLGGISIEQLKHSDSLRATVKSDVDDIMKKFGI